MPLIFMHLDVIHKKYWINFINLNTVLKEYKVAYSDKTSDYLKVAYSDKTSDYLTIDDFDGIQVILLSRVLKKHSLSFFFFCLHISQLQNNLNLFLFFLIKSVLIKKVYIFRRKNFSFCFFFSILLSPSSPVSI